MKDVIDNTDWSFDLVRNLIRETSVFIPRLLLFIALLAGAYIAMRLILLVLKKVLILSKIDDLAQNLSESELFSKVKIKPSAIIIGFVRFFLILLIIIFGADFLGLEVVSNEIGVFLGYIPRAFVAFILFALGVYLSIIVKKFVKELLNSFGWAGSNAIATIVSYLILIVAMITSLNQAGIDTHVITDNLSIILGAILGCFALAIGLGSKMVVQRILLSFYSKRNYQIGQRISFEGTEGTILSIDSISVLLKTTDGRLVIPIEDLVNAKVKILN